MIAGFFTRRQIKIKVLAKVADNIYMKMGELKERLDKHSKVVNGNIIFRPTKNAPFIEVDADIIKKSFDEIYRKIPLVQAGLDEFTECEKLAFIMICGHATF